MDNVTDLLPAVLRPYAKAVLAVVAVAVGALLLVLEPGETLSSITQREWLEIVGTLVGVGGVTYGARNDL